MDLIIWTNIIWWIKPEHCTVGSTEYVPFHDESSQNSLSPFQGSKDRAHLIDRRRRSVGQNQWDNQLRLRHWAVRWILAFSRHAFILKSPRSPKPWFPSPGPLVKSQAEAWQTIVIFCGFIMCIIGISFIGGSTCSSRICAIYFFSSNTWNKNQGLLKAGRDTMSHI